MPLDELTVSHLPAWFARGVSFLFGALWGSFFNVAIYRWPREMSVVSPPSHCPSCGSRVRWYLNVPLLGFLLLRGRAGCCGARLSTRYFWVELLSGVLCLALTEQFLVQADPETGLLWAVRESLLYFVFAGGLVIATFVDLEWMEIPDEVSLPGAALGLATVALRSTPGPVEAAIGAGVGFLIVQLGFVWGYEHLTGRRGMGEGDAKLLLMIGAFLGWRAVLFTLVAASVQGLLVAGAATLLGVSLIPEGAFASEPPPEEGEPSQPAPSAPMMVFGPMLAVAALEFLFFGPRILSFLAQLGVG